VGKAVPVLLEAGHRVHHLRPSWLRKSSQPTIGYDYDTFAGDLKTLMDKLDLATSLSPASRWGRARSPAILEPTAPSREKGRVVRTDPTVPAPDPDNPKGLPQSVFRRIQETITKDRYAFFKFFFDNFYNRRHVPRNSASANRRGTPASEVAAALVRIRHPRVRLDMADGLSAPTCQRSTARRSSRHRDRILPIDATGRRLPELVKDIRFVEIEGGPHNVGWTHPDEVNGAFDDFLNSGGDRPPLPASPARRT